MAGRNLRKPSNTLIIPLIALAAIGWGALFYLNGLMGRAAPGLRTTLEWLPYWCWSLMFIGAGVALWVFLNDLTVALLVTVISFYALTLFANIFVTANASLTGPIWPSLAAAQLVIANHRLGVRKPPE